MYRKKTVQNCSELYSSGKDPGFWSREPRPKHTGTDPGFWSGAKDLNIQVQIQDSGQGPRPDYAGEDPGFWSVGQTLKIGVWIQDSGQRAQTLNSRHRSRILVRGPRPENQKADPAKGEKNSMKTQKTHLFVKTAELQMWP